jgi:dynein light chain LC8-type
MLLTLLTGDRSPHQAHGSSKHSTPFAIETNRAQFDERKGATWHCIVGRNFGSFVTHGMRNMSPGMRLLDEDSANRTAETKHFIYFYLGHCAILLFKTQ